MAVNVSDRVSSYVAKRKMDGKLHYLTSYPKCEKDILKGLSSAKLHFNWEAGTGPEQDWNMSHKGCKVSIVKT